MVRQSRHALNFDLRGNAPVSSMSILRWCGLKTLHIIHIHHEVYSDFDTDASLR